MDALRLKNFFRYFQNLTKDESLVFNALILVNLVPELVHGGNFDKLAKLSDNWLPKGIHFYGTQRLSLSSLHLANWSIIMIAIVKSWWHRDPKTLTAAPHSGHFLRTTPLH